VPTNRPTGLTHAAEIVRLKTSLRQHVLQNVDWSYTRT
jgi:hypothetical protein